MSLPILPPFAKGCRQIRSECTGLVFEVGMKVECDDVEDDKWELLAPEQVLDHSRTDVWYRCWKSIEEARARIEEEEKEGDPAWSEGGRDGIFSFPGGRGVWSEGFLQLGLREAEDYGEQLTGTAILSPHGAAMKH